MRSQGGARGRERSMEAQHKGEDEHSINARPRALLRRVTGRIALLASTLGVIVLLGSAQAASAWHLTSVSPTTGCPNVTIKFTGTSFSGTSSLAEWYDPAAFLY